jgi:type I restriction enzyme S subunit
MIGQVNWWKEAWQWLPTIAGDSSFAGWDTVPLSDFLTRVVDPIPDALPRLQDLNVIEKVSFGGELFVRTSQRKHGYRGQLFRAQPGDMIISKIRAAQGSLCLVPQSLEHLAVSGEYPVYRPDASQIEPSFLSLLLRTPHFQATLRGLRSGNTGKARLRPVDFETLKIPLPGRAEQRRLVAAYRAALDAAAKLEAQAARVERQGQLEFEAALGLTPPPNLPKRRFQVARFKDIERWSHEGILQSVLLGDKAPESKFEMVTLEDIATVSYGLQKCPGNRPGKHPHPYLRVANVQRGRLDLREIKQINVPDADMPKYRLEPGDVLFVEGNGSRKELGRVAIWNGEIENCVHQNLIIKARLDQSKAVPEFLAAWFNTEAGRMHFFRNAKTTSGLGTINSTEVRTAPLPLPAKKVQAVVVRDLERSAAKAKSLRETAAQRRAAAWNDFIAAIFN